MFASTHGNAPLGACRYLGGLVLEASVLLSPSTVLIKAGGGRQEGMDAVRERRESYACTTA